MSNPVQPHRRQPTRLPHPWDLPGKNTGVGCHFLLQCMKGKSENEVIQSCPTLRNPMDCSLPGSSIHGIFQARVLEWCAIASLTLIMPQEEAKRFIDGKSLWSWSLGPNASSDTHQLKEKNLYGPQSYLIRGFSNFQLPHCIHCKTNYKNKCMKSQFGQMDYFHIP